MPWRTKAPMEEAIKFSVMAQSGRFTVAELCEQFGISRKTRQPKGVANPKGSGNMSGS